jgi:hypothetical protein
LNEPLQAVLAAHHDALQKAKLERETNRHQEAAQLELIALSLRCKLGHAPSIKAQDEMVRQYNTTGWELN